MIHSSRLHIFPLTQHELQLMLDNITLFETQKHLVYDGELLDTELSQIMEGQITIINQDPNHWLWHTFWLIVDQESRIVGSLCFKGPAIDETVEIGYGIGQKYRSMGYTTEAVKATCQWALTQQGVNKVIAETENNNLASRRVLEKAGFMFSHVKGEFSWWLFEDHSRTE
ncbi:MAG: GNAT family N-acetyltransferase [Candidatus Izemoplasmatales bacterium]|nr:GNAT family N-acetyltransferase [bacterium]MDZ4196750.1 GNAT family N-acetyltransferase [Candidatus Izemoplasmatales bacterium]